MLILVRILSFVRNFMLFPVVLPEFEPAKSGTFLNLLVIADQSLKQQQTFTHNAAMFQQRLVPLLTDIVVCVMSPRTAVSCHRCDSTVPKRY